jgi:Outer membrane protein beta-barrel domain
MKKIIFLPLLLVVGMVNAQLQFGLKGGVNISNFTGGDFHNIEKSAYVAWHAGGLVRIKFDHLVLQPEVLFSTQGAKLDDGTTEANYEITYVNIPIMLQWQFKGGFYVEGGPQAGFKVSEDIPNSTIDDFAKSTDFSIGLGLGFLKNKGLGIGGRYTVGVSKVGDFDSANIDPDFKNGVIQFSIIFVF